MARRRTYLIKGDGTVIYKQIGAITPDVLAKVDPAEDRAGACGRMISRPSGR